MKDSLKRLILAVDKKKMIWLECNIRNIFDVVTADYFRYKAADIFAGKDAATIPLDDQVEEIAKFFYPNENDAVLRKHLVRHFFRAFVHRYTAHEFADNETIRSQIWLKETNSQSRKLPFVFAAYKYWALDRGIYSYISPRVFMYFLGEERTERTKGKRTIHSIVRHHNGMGQKLLAEIKDFGGGDYLQGLRLWSEGGIGPLPGFA